MNYQDLKEQTAAKPEAQLDDYKKLFSLACVGGQVKDRLKVHLEAAENIDEFYATMYADDACRFENVWGYYAKMQGATGLSASSAKLLAMVCACS